MEGIYTIAALWLGLAVFSAIIAHHLRISIALVEICIGVVAANIVSHFLVPMPLEAILNGFVFSRQQEQ